MTSSIFVHPQEQWTDLLQEKTWEDVYEVEFPYLVSSGSKENLQFFMGIFNRGQLPSHDGQLANTITKEMFDTWTSEDLHSFLVYLRTRQSCLPLLYRAVLCGGKSKLNIPPDSPLFFYAVLNDQDLLAQLLVHADKKNHSTLVANLIEQIAPSYTKEFDGAKVTFTIVNRFSNKMFSTITVACLPEYCDQVVKHICTQIRFRLGIKLSLQQRVNQFAADLWARWVSGEEAYSIDKLTYQNQIDNLEEFARNHQDSLNVENWRHLVTLFNQINKTVACDTSQTPLLNMYALKGRLEDVTQEASEHVCDSIPSPPRRKM